MHEICNVYSFESKSACTNDVNKEDQDVPMYSAECSSDFSDSDSESAVSGREKPSCRPSEKDAESDEHSEISDMEVAVINDLADTDSDMSDGEIQRKFLKRPRPATQVGSSFSYHTDEYYGDRGPKSSKLDTEGSRRAIDDFCDVMSNCTGTIETLSQHLTTYDDSFPCPHDFTKFRLAIRNGRPYTRLRFDRKGENLELLLDTGCYPNLISQSCFLSLSKRLGPERVRLERTMTSLQSHTGHGIHVIGKTTLPMYLQEEQGKWRKFEHMEWLVTSGEHSMIVGNCFLTARHAGLEYLPDAGNRDRTIANLCVPTTSFDTVIKDSWEKTEAGPSSFVLKPLKAVRILPKKSSLVTCAVTTKPGENMQALRGAHCTLEYSIYKPRDCDFAVQVSSNLTMTVPVYNDQEMGVEIEPGLEIATGYVCSEKNDQICANLTSAIATYKEAEKLESWTFPACVCELESRNCRRSEHPSGCANKHENFFHNLFTDPEKSFFVIHFVDNGGATNFAGYNLCGTSGPSERIRRYVVQRQHTPDGAKHVFVRGGRIDAATAQKIVSLAPKGHPILVPAPETLLKQRDLATAALLNQAAKLQEKHLIIGVFPDKHLCSAHQRWKLHQTPKTVVHFTFKANKRNGNLIFKKNYPMTTLKKIEKLQAEVQQLEKPLKKGLNIVVCTLPEAARMRAEYCQSIIRTVTDEIFYHAPSSRLTITTEKFGSTFAIHDAMAVELGFLKSSVDSFESQKGFFKAMGLGLGRETFCISEVHGTVSLAQRVSRISDSSVERYIVDMDNALEVCENVLERVDNKPKPLPNPETPKGYEEAVNIGKQHEDTESYVEFLQKTKQEIKSEVWPDGAKDNRSEITDKSIHSKVEGNLPEKGPGADPNDRCQHWSELNQEGWREGLTVLTQEEYSKLLDEFNDCIQMGKGHLKGINFPPLDIDVRKAHLLKKAYPCDKKKQAILARILELMAGEGFLKRVTQSPYTSPCFLVMRGREIKEMSEEERDKLTAIDPRKVWRIVVDLSGVNQLVDKQSNDLPTVEDCIDHLQGHTVFSLVDLAELFHNIRITPKLAQILSLIAPPNLIYEPQFAIEGFISLPVYASHIVQSLRQLSRDNTVSFLDDICIFTHSKPEMKEVMRKLFEDLREANAMINLNKLELEKTGFKYLGMWFELDEKDNLTYKPMTQKFHIFEKITITDVHSVQKYLGLIAFISGFVPSLATLCKPMYKILSENSGKPKTTKVTLSEVQQEAFELLNKTLMKVERLYVPGRNGHLCLYVDAGGTAFGAVLTAILQGEEFVSQYHSKRFTTSFANSNNSLSKEAYAVMEEVCKFKLRIMGAEEVTVYSDCRTFVYLMDKMVQSVSIIPNRWMMILGHFQNINYVHVKRENMAGPDYLGRVGEGLPLPINEDVPGTNPHYKKAKLCDINDKLLTEGKKYRFADFERVRKENAELLNADHLSTCNECKADFDIPEQEYFANEAAEVSEVICDIEDSTRDPVLPVCQFWASEIEGNHEQSLKTLHDTPIDGDLDPEGILTGQAILQAQQKDKDMRRIVRALRTGGDSQKKYQMYTLFNGMWLLRKKQKDAVKRRHMQLCIPDRLMTQMLCNAHRLGHPNYVKLCQMMRRFFYNPKMSVIAQKLVLACRECQLNKQTTKTAIPMGMLKTPKNPYETLFVDYFYMPKAYHKGKNYKYILTIVDHYSLMVWAFATKDMKSSTFIEIIDNFRKVAQCTNMMIVADNQPSILQNQQSQKYMVENNIKFRTVFPYVSKNNLAEIGNKMLRGMLRILAAEHHNEKWPKYLPEAVHWCNSLSHITKDPALNGVTPLELINGQAQRNNPFADMDAGHKSREEKDRLRGILQALRDGRKARHDALVQERQLLNRIQPGTPVVLRKMDPERKGTPNHPEPVQGKQNPYFHEIHWIVDKVKGHKVWISLKENRSIRRIMHITDVKYAGALEKELFNFLNQEQQELYGGAAETLIEPNWDSDSDVEMEFPAILGNGKRKRETDQDAAPPKEAKDDKQKVKKLKQNVAKEKAKDDVEESIKEKSSSSSDSESEQNDQVLDQLNEQMKELMETPQNPKRKRKGILDRFGDQVRKVATKLSFSSKSKRSNASTVYDTPDENPQSDMETETGDLSENTIINDTPDIEGDQGYDLRKKQKINYKTFNQKGQK